MLIAAPILGQGSYHRVVRPNLGFYLHHAEEGHTVDDIVVSLSSSSGRSDDGSFQAIRLADKKIAAYLMQDVDGTHHTEHLRTIVSRTVSPGSFYSVDKYAGVDLYQAGMRENLFLPEHVFQLASAIVALHDQGLVHRDIKPDNVMLSPKTDNGFVQLGDFGFLTAFDEEKQKDAVMQLSQDQDFQSLCDHNNLDAGAQISRALTHLSVSHACGTKEYISPKAARGEPYRKSDDIYSFAATLLAVTTQEEPEFFSTDGKYPSRFDPNRGVKLSQGYHEGRKHQFGLWHILAANGQVLTEAFTAVLQEMILNVEKPVDERIEDIGYFVDKLQSALSEHGLYRPNKGGLFGCIPCLA
jgi:serine/threonine protein kinase